MHFNSRNVYTDKNDLKNWNSVIITLFLNDQSQETKL